MKKWSYKWLPIFFGCHTRNDRSFHYKGKKFPICARCTGELIGIIFSLATCYFFRVNTFISLIMLIPLIVDGVVQMKTNYESKNYRRFITGILFGYALINLIAISSIYTYDLGKNCAIKFMR